MHYKVCIVIVGGQMNLRKFLLAYLVVYLTIVILLWVVVPIVSTLKHARLLPPRLTRGARPRLLGAWRTT